MTNTNTEKIDKKKPFSPKKEIIEKTTKKLQEADKILTKTPSPEEKAKAIVQKAKSKIKEEAKKIVKKLKETGEKIPKNKPETTPETTLEEQLANLENPGKLHSKYLEKTSKIDEKTALSKLKNQSTSEIRSNPLLLTGKKEKPEETIKNLKTETAKRIKAYTNWQTDEWYALDYKKVGEDHEWEIGLGDILVDPDIKEVLIFTKEGQLIKAHRGIVSSGKHKNRVGFLDKNGQYVATFTGDKFRIMTGTETNIKMPGEVKKYMATFNKESESREKYKEKCLQRKFTNANIEVDITEEELKNKNSKYISDKEVKNKVGNSVYAYAKKVCKKFNIPWSIYKTLINYESGWKNVSYKGPKDSSAGGLGQFIDTTWSDFVSYCKKNNIHQKEWKKDPPSKFDPYANAYATAWLMNKTKKKFQLSNKPIQKQAIVYYLAHHEGAGNTRNYLNFIEAMRNDGCTTKGEIITNFHKHKNILSKKQIGRINKYGRDDFLSIYFKFAKGIAIAALQDSPSDLNKYKETLTKKNEKLVQQFDGAKGLIDVHKNNKKVVIGSSSTVGLIGLTSEETGVFGRSGANAKGFHDKELMEYWPKIAKVIDVSNVTIIIDGFALNGLNNKLSPQKCLDNHLKIIKFLTLKGVKESNIKIATIHQVEVSSNKILNKQIPAFNNLLKTNGKYKNYYIDIASSITSGIHLTEAQKKIKLNNLNTKLKEMEKIV